MRFRTPIHILAAQRTPIGRLGGALASLSAVDLAVAVAESVLPGDRTLVDQSIFGQVLQAGTGMNLARQVALRTNLSQVTPGFTVNMVCGSGLKAVALAAGALDGGEGDLILCGGAESMTHAPHLLKDLRSGKKYGASTVVDTIEADGLTDPLLGILMGETAERIADKFNISRSEQDEWSARSQARAVASREAFAREIVPVHAKEKVEVDEHPRPDTTAERLGRLKPAFRPHGSVTAGNASGLNDGAAALLLGTGKAAATTGLTPRATIIGARSTGCDPALMGLGPVYAIRELCAELGWNPAEVDAIEINEAFAAQTLTCIKELELDPERVNIRGGAIALGHPIGASGARVLVTLFHILEDTGARRGIASLCIGGGMGIALAIERP